MKNTTFKKELYDYRKRIIEKITAIVSGAADETVRFRADAEDPDDGEQVILYDLNIGDKDEDGCYPTVTRVETDADGDVIVRCTGTYSDPDYELSDLSADDLASLLEGLEYLTQKVYCVKLYYHGCLELEVTASGEEEALLEARREASSMPGDRFIAESALTDEEHDVTEVGPEEMNRWFASARDSIKTGITGIAQSSFPEDDDGTAFAEACGQAWSRLPEDLKRFFFISHSGNTATED